MELLTAFSQVPIDVLTRPPFYSIQFWAWPIMYMFGFMGVFMVPALSLKCDFDDIIVSALIGLNFGVVMGIVSSITPFYIIVFTLILLFGYLIFGGD